MTVSPAGSAENLVRRRAESAVGMRASKVGIEKSDQRNKGKKLKKRGDLYEPREADVFTAHERGKGRK